MGYRLWPMGKRFQKSPTNKEAVVLKRLSGEVSRRIAKSELQCNMPRLRSVTSVHYVFLAKRLGFRPYIYRARFDLEICCLP